jgi:hypothetical protein
MERARVRKLGVTNQGENYRADITHRNGLGRASTLPSMNTVPPQIQDSTNLRLKIYGKNSI